MTVDQIVAETESELRVLAAGITDVLEGECLLCYVWRMLDEFGCTGLRWARHYRDRRAPRATGMERRLGQRGGYCDCEIFLNAYELAPEYWIHPPPSVEDGVTYEEDPHYPDELPACRGVRKGSTQGCPLWVRHRRGLW